MERGKSSEKRKILYGILAILCITALILGVIIVVKILNNQPQIAETQNATSAETQEAETSNAELDNYIREMEEKIQTARTNEEKAELYLERSMEIANGCIKQCESYYKIALSDAYKAEETYPSAESAWLIFNFEILSGEDEQIAEQYRKLAEERGMDTEGAG